MYNKQDEVFEFNGKQVTARKPHACFWPCRSCALIDDCYDNYGKEHFPVCRAADREDRTDVVFQLADTRTLKRKEDR